MSTLATADLGPSDEEDQDFVPTSPKRTSGKRRRSGTASSSISSSTSNTDGRKEAKAEEAKRDEAERRRRAAEAFAILREDKLAGPSTTDPNGKDHGVEMVAVKRARRFAGETLYETVMLPATEIEAIAYLAGQSIPANVPSKTDGPSTPSLAATYTPMSSALPTTTSSSSPSLEPPSATKPTPISKPPARRKPRQSLEQMSAALSSGKKMTTLEKSQLDWKSHMAADQKVKDELEANRRSGGFLEKREFLERVGERRSGALEGSKGGRR